MSYKVYGQFFDGAEQPVYKGTSPVFNPATGKVIAETGHAGKETTESVIEKAAKAGEAWAAMIPAKRASVFYRFRELLMEHQDEICRIITEEHGKTIADARGELQRGIENVEFACGIPALLKGEYSSRAGSGISTRTELFPLGVVAGITPFNFPAMVPLWMYPAAIACGNSFILKPSEKDPGVSLYMAGLFSQAGLPDNVFTVLNGNEEVVTALIDDLRVQAFSFVGSTAVARKIYERCGARGKRVQALGGAKNHAVVTSDADLEMVGNGLMGAVFGSAGERCMAISVAVCIGDETADRLVASMVDKIRALKVGNGMDETSDMGPLISLEHRERVRSYIDKGVEEGAELIVDGRELEFRDGFFIGPSLFDRVKPGMSIYRDEIFGPVLSVVRVKTLEEAVQLINSHQYGNGSCLYTKDGGSADFYTRNVSAGMVGVNVPLPVPVAYHSFGGWKDSLMGDHYAYGPDSINFYTRKKTISERWDSGTGKSISYSFPSHGS
ncbi:MAG: CoA-acylating methylmalonate-semialdehyde dehydrogenase [Spirochaetales bacterium]|nr:CoA-acylating methylmalonate-semialdehyde dehydrogenase [Spirochaetales bacterium]